MPDSTLPFRSDSGPAGPSRAPSASACEPYRELIDEALTHGRNVDTSLVRAGLGAESVDTSAEIVGFGGPSPGRPRLRMGMPAARRYSPTVTRCTPVARPMRVSVHPKRPSARTSCCLCGSETLLMAARDYTSIAAVKRPGRRQLIVGFAVSGSQTTAPRVQQYKRKARL